MKNDPLRFLLVFACICGCSRAVGTVRPSGNDPEAVAPVRWARFDPAPVSGRLEDRVRTILLNSNKYALNKWYDQVKKLGGQSGEYLDFGGIREHPSGGQRSARVGRVVEIRGVRSGGYRRF